MADDAQVDGYLVYVLSLAWESGTDALVNAIAKAGRPMVVVEDHFAGPFSLGFNGRAEKAGWKTVCLSTSRLKDVADVLRCFQVLKQPGATADQFLEAARATYKKNIAPMGDLACTADATPKCDVGKCLEQLRSSTILAVGGGWGMPGSGKAIEEEFGAKVVGIPHAELHEAFLKADPAEAAQRADQWMKGAEKMLEAKREDVVKSGAMHLAMQEVMKKYNARAITINCLGGFYSGALQAYPCLGFVEFNNSGLVGACEGDLQSTITMLAMGILTGRPGFISDPVIDLAKNQIIYAHCVAPTKVFGPEGAANPYHIRSHSEDRRGAAVRSLMPLGYMTTTLEFIPGRRQAIFHQGKTVANIDEDKACRTKLAVEVKGDINKLFSGWGEGWHRVTYYGDLREPLQELCKALNITLVEEA
jgi:L-fucose isomerase-like protein